MVSQSFDGKVKIEWWGCRAFWHEQLGHFDSHGERHEEQKWRGAISERHSTQAIIGKGKKKYSKIWTECWKYMKKEWDIRDSLISDHENYGNWKNKKSWNDDLINEGEIWINCG